MADPTLVLLVLVATAGEHAGATVVGGVREALGGAATVLIEERATPPTDAESRALAERLKANAVAELDWTGHSRSRAHVHVFIAADQTSYDRELSFEPTDDIDERERAVGLLLGAMVRAATNAEDEDAGKPAAPTPKPVEPARTADARPSAPPSPSGGRRRSFALDVAATSALPVAGEGSGIGPSLGAQLDIVPLLGIRASGVARFGSVPAAEADTTTARLGGGLALRLVGRDEGATTTLTLAIEGVLVNHAVSRSSPPAREDRWLMGTSAMLSAGWRVDARFEPFVGAGVEAVYGITPVVIDHQIAATIPPVRIIADVGARVRF